jgi:hypothetical protein
LSHPCAARQTLADGLGQGEILGTGQDVFSRCALFVNHPLQIREQFRNPLHLVKYRSFGVRGKKTPAVFRRKLANVGILQ